MEEQNEVQQSQLVHWNLRGGTVKLKTALVGSLRELFWSLTIPSLIWERIYSPLRKYGEQLRPGRGVTSSSRRANRGDRWANTSVTQRLGKMYRYFCRLSLCCVHQQKKRGKKKERHKFLSKGGRLIRIPFVHCTIFAKADSGGDLTWRSLPPLFLRAPTTLVSPQNEHTVSSTGSSFVAQNNPKKQSH